MTLLEFIRELFSNTALQQDFAENPEGTLHDHGLDGITPTDVHDALVLASDDQDADFSRSYDTGHNSIGYSAPPPPAHHDYATPADSHEAAVQYLNTYVTNNYIDDRDTIVDHSINQQIDTGGGDFDQDIDVHSTTASGDGAVAAGGDIENSTVTTGDDNQVGDGNVKGDGNVVGDDNQAVTGDHNTTSFGEGDATTTTVGGDVHVGAGGAFGSGGHVTVDNSDNSQHDVGNTTTDNSVHDSFNDSSDHSVHDSFNTEEEHHGLDLHDGIAHADVVDTGADHAIEHAAV